MSVRLGMYMKSDGRAAKVINWLDAAGLYNLDTLCKLYRDLPSDAIKILVKWQRQSVMHRKQLDDGSVVDAFALWAGTRQFELEPLFATGIIGPVGVVPEGDAGFLTTEKSIEQFLVDTFSTKSASDRRALMFWGHADGPGGVLFMRLAQLDAGNRSVSHRHLPQPKNAAIRTLVAAEPDWLSLFEVDTAFTRHAAKGDGESIDLVCFDACQDATIELAAVLAPHVRVMIANQSSTPIYGWPFDKWTMALDTEANPAIEDCARRIVAAYAGMQYENGVISAIDLKHVADMLPAIRAISEVLLADWQRLLPTFHRAAMQCPTIPNSFADKRDVVKLFSEMGLAAVATSPAPQTLVGACSTLVALAAKATIAKSDCKATPTYGYNGLSIYLPDGSLKMSQYARSVYAAGTSDFANFKVQTRWDEVVQRYTHFLSQAAATHSLK